MMSIAGIPGKLSDKRNFTVKAMNVTPAIVYPALLITPAKPFNTYEISNYPTGETGVQAGLLIYKNTVVGGEVLSSQLGGFIHGLAMPG